MNRKQQEIIDFQNAQIRILMDKMGARGSSSPTTNDGFWPSKQRLSVAGR